MEKLTMGIVRALYHHLIPQKMPNWSAGYYDKLIDGVSEFYIKPFCEKILTKYLGPIRILDIGTGTGQLPIMLAQNNKNYKITAIDLSGKCIEIAQAKAVSAGVDSKINFTLVDLMNDNWKAKSFDLIVSTCSMHHWQNPVGILTKARQLLADNGEIWILDDLAGVAIEARREWIKKVECACNAGWLFRTVFTFESNFLAYSHSEILDICKKSGLYLSDFLARDIFFIAQMTPKRVEM
jgi:2-polyprenyl-3-methyl-5-hydroxy-6-metoxy-1,4-benzoquinol methylase